MFRILKYFVYNLVMNISAQNEGSRDLVYLKRKGHYAFFTLAYNKLDKIHIKFSVTTFSKIAIHILQSSIYVLL